MRYCSVPALLGLRHWFEPRFGDLCRKHDRRYIERIFKKWDVDAVFIASMSRRGNRYIPLAAITWLFLWSPFGFWYWYTE